jgi:hypothetical protein
MFNITKIYSDNNGDSRFEDVNIPLNAESIIGSLSEEIPAKNIMFREVEPSYDLDYHNAPQRQYVIFLDGETEIETSTGDKRIFKAGDILLAEDTTGKGHKSRNLKHEKRKSIFITLID